MSSKNHVQVFVRIKPTDKFANDVIHILPDKKTLTISSKEEAKKGYINNQLLDWSFSVDGILENAPQNEVFDSCASRLIKETLDGYNCTLFAYGQTGAGKTHTMTGTTTNFQHRGIIPRAISKLYRDIQDLHEYDITVRVSYLEIYKESMYDLLSTISMENSGVSKMVVCENDQGMTYVKGLGCHIAKSEEDALNFLFEGESNRILSHHKLNRYSSRSHCIFTIHVESHSRTDTETRYTISKLNLVDLAGSERIGKTQSFGETQVEALEINKSLTFLEQTVIALDDRSRSHVPYRQSKLTHILKDSIGGSCSTVMIANIWGEADHIEETLSTLRFAVRVMNVPSQPCINRHENYQLLCRKYAKEIALLRKELAMYNTLANHTQICYEPLSESQIKDMQLQVRKFIDGDLDEIEIVNIRQIKEIFEQFKQIVLCSEKQWETKRKGSKKSENRDSADKGSENINLTPERLGLVGETDGTSFNVGRAANGVKPATSSAVANAKKKSRKVTKENQQEIERKASPLPLPPTVTSAVYPNSSNMNSADQKDPSADNVVVSGNIDQSDSVPPSKSEAFDMFKAEHGNEMNKTFQENKEILRMKKSEAKAVANTVNEIKKSIDEIKFKLEHCQKENEFSVNHAEDTNIVLEEDEFELVTKLQTLKNEYRFNHQLLQTLNSDITYCENLVKQCRKVLLSEFNSWYEECFGHILSKENSQTNPVRAYSPVKFSAKEDDGERFENVQKKLLLKSPDSYTFYNARMETDRRRLYNDVSRKRHILPKLKNAPHFLPVFTS